MNVSRIVHDLRSHLAVISGYGQLLETQPEPDLSREAARQILLAAAKISAELDRLVAPTVDPTIQAAGAARATSRRQPQRIVVADDDVLIGQLIRVTLPAARYDVVHTRDGQECLEEIERHVPDLVILDWVMPRVGGRAVLDALRREHPAVPVIVLTGSLPEGTIEPGAAGADSLLTKPFSPLELLAEIERLLARSARPTPG